MADYYEKIQSHFFRAVKKSGIMARIPVHLYQDILWEKDLIVVILEHMDYYMKLQGLSSSFSYAAYSVSQLKEPLPGTRTEWLAVKGVGETTATITMEIQKTGKSSHYERLLAQI